MTTATAPSAALPRVVVAGTFASMLTLSIPNAYGPAVPSIAASSGVDVALVGQLSTIHGAGAFAGLLLWIRVARRRSTATIVTTSLATLGLGAVAVALNPLARRTAAAEEAFVVLAVTAAVIGFAFGISIVALNSVVANRGASPRLLNAANGMYGLGAVALPLLVGLADLRAAVLVTAALALVSVPLLRRTPDLSAELAASRRARAGPRSSEGDRPDPARRSRRLRRLWYGTGSRPWVWMFGVAIGVEIGTAAWAATHLVSVGVTEGRAAAAVAGFFAAFTLSRFVIAWIGERVAMRAVVVGSNVLAALAAAAAGLLPVPAIAWVLVGLGVGPVFPTGLAWLTRVTGDPDGARRMNVGGAIGGVLLPGLIGLLVGAAGPDVIPWAVAAYAIAAAVLAATLTRADGRRPAAGAAASVTP